MSNSTLENAQSKGKKTTSWGRRIVSLLTVLIVIAITVALFIYRDRIEDLEGYGYLGAFLISLIANATIILPMPGLLILIGLGAAFNPYLVAIIGAAGGTIGEMTGYVLGITGRGITSDNKWYDRAERWMKKRGFLAVFLFALLPVLPLDVVGLIAGILRFPIWKFLIACFLGKGILYIIMIKAGAFGWDALVSFFT